MALFKSKQTLSGAPVPSAAGATSPIAIFADYALAGTEASGDIIEMAPLPAGYVPVDVIADTADMGTTATADVGFLSGAYRENTGASTQGAQFMTGKAFGTAGIYRMDVVGGGRIAPTTGDRAIGIKLTTVDTPTAGAAVRLTVIARPAIDGV